MIFHSFYSHSWTNKETSRRTLAEVTVVLGKINNCFAILEDSDLANQFKKFLEALWKRLFTLDLTVFSAALNSSPVIGYVQEFRSPIPCADVEEVEESFFFMADGGRRPRGITFANIAVVVNKCKCRLHWTFLEPLCSNERQLVK